MQNNHKYSSSPTKRRKSLRLTGLLSVMALLLGVVGIGMAADDGNGRPIPEAGSTQTPSPYAGVVDSDLELSQRDPSLERYVDAHSIAPGLAIPANIASSSMTSKRPAARPNGVVEFAIVVPNTGDADAAVTVTNKLPAGLEYISSLCEALVTSSCSAKNGTVTWQGTAVAGQEAVVRVFARVLEDAQIGSRIVNTADITTNGETLTRNATIEIVRATAGLTQFLPMTEVGLVQEGGPGPVALSVTQPNSANAWTLSWNWVIGAGNYELQEAPTPDFATATTYIVPTADTSLLIQRVPTTHNLYYYRMRSVIGSKAGPWSNTVNVVSGYLDTFDNVNSGWAMRRTTFKEEVKGFYETMNGETWYVMQILDRWDWGIASPGRPAPRVPYVISYDVKTANLGHLLSAGFTFGADWPGINGCPSDPNSFDGVYKHKECFNHFYNVNVIYYLAQNNALKLLFERVDQLVWCLDCGGSPMKRIGDIDASSAKDLTGMDLEGWNHYRIEVREDGIKVYAGKRGSEPTLQKVYTDTRWIHDPFFGVFASTDEYSNSTWRFDNVMVMPLDN